MDRSVDDGATWERSTDVAIPGVSYRAAARVEGAQSDDTHADGTPSDTSGRAEPLNEQTTGIPVSDQSFHGRGVIQPTLWESSDGPVHMLLRSTEGRIYRSDSTDGGRTWSAAYATELPNNNSGIDLVRLSDGRLILAYNPVGRNWGERTPLSLALSDDDGTTWTRLGDVVAGEGEFSYPAIVADGDRVFLSYTYNREGIAVFSFPISDVNR